MSDATRHGEPDFRPTRETKRRDETVMLGQEAISSLVDEARAAPAPGSPAAPAGPSAASTPAPDGASSGGRLIVLATGVIVVVLVVVALVYNLVS